MRNGGMEEAQAGIKIVGRNISNLSYADDATKGRKQRGIKEFFDEGEREEWKNWLKIQHSKN